MRKREYSLLFLDKVEKVQRIYRENKREEVTNVGIYRKFIENVFYIGERQFYRYLAINVNQERRKRKGKTVD